jgi:hypothetical protein
MLPAEVVMGEHQAQSGPVVASALREAIGQPPHPLTKIADRAVHTFRVGSIDLAVFRFAKDQVFPHAYYSRRRILATVLADWLTEYLDESTVINTVAKLPLDRERVGKTKVGTWARETLVRAAKRQSKA